MPAARFFFKHAKCSAGWRRSVFAIDVEERATRRDTQWEAMHAVAGIACPGCGGTVVRPDDWTSRGVRLSLMGRVDRNRLFVSGLACPCDGRCTNAVGPSCDCSCGGKNHGSGRLVEIVRDNGAAPRLVRAV